MGKSHLPACTWTLSVVGEYHTTGQTCVIICNMWSLTYTGPSASPRRGPSAALQGPPSPSITSPASNSSFSGASLPSLRGKWETVFKKTSFTASLHRSLQTIQGLVHSSFTGVRMDSMACPVRGTLPPPCPYRDGGTSSCSFESGHGLADAGFGLEPGEPQVCKPSFTEGDKAWGWVLCGVMRLQHWLLPFS